MKISVIIPCLNMGSTLKRAIDSALSQCHEVVVVDDGSTDNTAAVLDGIDHPKLKRIFHRNTRGVCASRNAGIVLADGDWFVPLDADDALNDNVLSIMRVNANAQHFVYGDWLEVENGYPAHRTAPPIGMLNRKNVAKATFLFSRSMWETAGGYDDDFEITGGEDWSFMLSLVEAGYRGVHVELPVYHYEPSQDGRAERVRQNEAQILALLRQKYPNVMGP